MRSPSTTTRSATGRWRLTTDWAECEVTGDHEPSPQPPRQRHDALVERGRNAHEAGKSTEAFERFREAISTAPDDPVACLETAARLQGMRLITQARAQLESVLPR